MGFTIPNDVVGGSLEQRTQATPFQSDIDILAAGHNQTGVQSGCAVTAQGTPNMTVAVASGTVAVGGSTAAVASGNVTITANSTVNPRLDLIVANSSGVKSAIAGATAAAPVLPGLPINTVALAAVWVPAGATAIATADIVDKRVLLTSAAAASFIVATTVNPMGSSHTITAGGLPSAVFEGTLDQASCALTFTGFTAGKYSEILVSIVGSSSKTCTFVDTIAWSGGFAPVFSTVGVTEFTIFSLDGVNLRGAHNQQIRNILWGPGNANTLASSVSSPPYSVFNDARIVGGILRLSTTGTVQSTKVDVNINGTTAYTTQANRPTVAISATSSGNITLPDIVLLTPGQYITFDIDQFGTSAAGLAMMLRVLEAA